MANYFIPYAFMIQNKINQMNDDIKKIKSDHQEEIYNLNDKIYNLQNQNEMKDERNEELEKKVNNLQYDYNNIYYTNQFQTNQINQLINENYNLRSNYEYYKNSEQTLKNKNNELENRCNQLNGQIYSIRNEYQIFQKNYNKLEKKLKDEKQRKLEKEKKLKIFTNTFKNDIKEIENKNIKESKKYILNYILNEFIKDFREKKNNITANNSLMKNLSVFVDQFVSQCKYLNDYLKEETIKIIDNYKVNESNIKVEHINFIIMGPTGIGKSTFINESLLLEGNKKAPEGKGLPVTEKSRLYCSEKLEVIRMWDTEGVSYKISQNKILNEIKRLVDEGLSKGIDNYINVILYCIKDDRFQEEDAKLISEIMKIYPMDNLPVIITRLQAYFEEDSKEMEEKIRQILDMFLEPGIAKKIEIANVISRDKNQIKAKGIPELLYSSIYSMGRAITSGTFKNIAQDIEQLCKIKMLKDEKINYLNLKMKDEMEVLEQIKYPNMEEDEDYFKIESIEKKNLSQQNFYNTIAEVDSYGNNMISIIAMKFLDIFNKLNNTHYSLNDNDQSQILKYILEILNKIKKDLNHFMNETFEKKLFGKLFEKYYKELRKQQIKRSNEFHISEQVLVENEIESAFKEKLVEYFKRVFYKYYICSIIELCINNIKSKVFENHQKLLNEDHSMIKIINAKAETNLKFISKELRQKLMKKLNQYFKKLIIMIRPHS